MSLNSLSELPPKASAEPRGSAHALCTRCLDMELEDLKSAALWKAVLAEFIGCLLLVYFGVGSALSDSETEPPAGIVEGSLAAGFFIAAIITTLSTASGAHVNPAVSLGFLLTRQCSCVRFFLYVLAQSAGAVTGAALLKAVTPEAKIGNLGLLQPAAGVTSEQALMAEFVITFFLLFCIIAMLDKGRVDLGGSIPFIVGIVVIVNIFYAHNISGAAMNPIRNFGPAVVLGNMDNQWIYWVGPLLGGATGSLLYDWVFSVAMTPAKLTACCLSREGVYQGVCVEGDETGTPTGPEVRDQLIEVKPEPSLTHLGAGSTEINEKL